jgi:hypothetical protein
MQQYNTRRDGDENIPNETHSGLNRRNGGIVYRFVLLHTLKRSLNINEPYANNLLSIHES